MTTQPPAAQSYSVHPVASWWAAFIPEAAPVSFSEKIRMALFAGMAILLSGVVSSWFLQGMAVPMLVASMGASAVLIFGVSGSPLAQPWAFVGGHLVSASCGILCARWIPEPMLAAGVALFMAVAGMLTLRCLHPPGGAVVLLTVLGGSQIQQAGWHFLLLPLSLNLLLMLSLALVFNNMLPGRRYPAPRIQPNLHLREDPSPLERLGLKHADLEHSLRSMGVLVDITRADLDRIYRQAQSHAIKRKLGEITCADIMSRDVASVQFATSLQEAWTLLHHHKIKALPVIDRGGHVQGVVTLVDFLKAARLNQPDNLREHIRAFLRPSGETHGSRPEVVGQLMSKGVVVAQASMHVVDLVEFLSDKGLHHIPIVDESKKLVGMVTQSDLVAALFHSG